MGDAELEHVGCMLWDQALLGPAGSTLTAENTIYQAISQGFFMGCVADSPASFSLQSSFFPASSSRAEKKTAVCAVLADIWGGRCVESWKDVAAQIKWDSSGSETSELQRLARRWMCLFARWLQGGWEVERPKKLLLAATGSPFLPLESNKNLEVGC